MANYRLFIFAGNRESGPNHRVAFHCASDAEAVRKARELADGRMAELWKDGLFVWSAPARSGR